MITLGNTEPNFRGIQRCSKVARAASNVMKKLLKVPYFFGKSNEKNDHISTKLIYTHIFKMNFKNLYSKLTSYEPIQDFEKTVLRQWAFEI